MNLTPKTLGAIQAVCLALYVSFFGIAVRQIGQWLTAHNLQPHPIFGIIIFLLAFVISAAICGAIVFGHSVLLFFANKKGEAVAIFLWTLAWLVVLFIIFAAIGFAVLLQKL